MKEWRRVPSDTICGYCGVVIRADFPAQFTRLPEVKRERVRCPLCAGEPAPDLPERIQIYNSITPTPKPRVKRFSTFQPPRDYTARLLGERE